MPVALAFLMALCVWGTAHAQEGVEGEKWAANDLIPREKWIGKEQFGDFAIVVSDKAPAAEKRAAEEFKRLWKLCTGKEIPIQNKRGPKLNVWIGFQGAPKPLLQEMQLVRLPMSRNQQVSVDRQIEYSGLGNDGFQVQTIGDSLLIIGGGKRGTMNGVAWFFKTCFKFDPAAVSIPPPPAYLPKIEERIVPPQVAWKYVLYILLGLVALFFVHWAVNQFYGEEVPIVVALPLAVLAVGSCVFFFMWFLQLLSAIWGPFAQPLAPILTFGVCFWPVRGYAMTVAQGFGKRGVQFMYGYDESTPTGDEEYAPPQVFQVSEEVNKKVQDYRGIFSADPSHPRPLFEAAQLLEHHEYYEEAAEQYREIIQLFHKDDELWAEANFRLASLHENALFNRRGAAEIFRRISGRAGDTEYGRLAAARLAETATDKNEEGPDIPSTQSM